MRTANRTNNFYRFEEKNQYKYSNLRLISNRNSIESEIAGIQIRRIVEVNMARIERILAGAIIITRLP